MKRVAIAVLLLSVLPLAGQKPPALGDEPKAGSTRDELHAVFTVTPGKGSSPEWTLKGSVRVTVEKARPCSIPLLTFKPKVKGYIKEFTPPESGHKIREIEPPAPPWENWPANP